MMKEHLLPSSQLPLDHVEHLPGVELGSTDSESELPSDYDEEADSGIELGSSDSISEFELASQDEMTLNNDDDNLNIRDPTYVPSEADSIDDSDFPQLWNILEMAADGSTLKYFVQLWVDSKDMGRLAKLAVDEPCSSEISLDDGERFSI